MMTTPQLKLVLAAVVLAGGAGCGGAGTSDGSSEAVESLQRSTNSPKILSTGSAAVAGNGVQVTIPAVPAGALVVALCSNESGNARVSSARLSFSERLSGARALIATAVNVTGGALTNEVVTASDSTTSFTTCDVSVLTGANTGALSHTQTGSGQSASPSLAMSVSASSSLVLTKFVASPVTTFSTSWSVRALAQQRDNVHGNLHVFATNDAPSAGTVSVGGRLRASASWQAAGMEVQAAAASTPMPTPTPNPSATPTPTPTPTPVACTFSYSAWTACQADGTQTRTVVSTNPFGCTGGSPVLTQTCSGSSLLPTPNHYVDCSLSTNGSGSAASPWSSLSGPNGHQFAPGDVLGLRAGTTCTGSLVLKQSGTSASPITVTRYGSGNKPVIDPNNSAGYAIWISAGVSYVVIDGISVVNHPAGGSDPLTDHVVSAVGAGISSGTDSSTAGGHNVIRNCEISGTGYGIDLWNDYNTVTQNYIHDLRMIVDDPASNNDYGAVGVSIEHANWNTISYNTFSKLRAASHDYTWDGGMIEFYEFGSNNDVHHNLVTDTMGFYEMDGAGPFDNNRLYYNVVINNYDNPAGCIHVPVTGHTLENNTVVAASGNTTGYGMGCGGSLDGSSSVRNNIFVLDVGQGILQVTLASNVKDHNIWWRRDNTAPSGVGSDRTVNPLLHSLTDGHLSSGSPAIAAGVALGYTSDLDGVAVSASAPNIGAYQ